MSATLRITLNGTERDLSSLGAQASVAALVASLGFRPDRVALEKNGEIIPRATWPETPVEDGDRIELVHFVGGGC